MLAIPPPQLMLTITVQVNPHPNEYSHFVRCNLRATTAADILCCASVFIVYKNKYIAQAFEHKLIPNSNKILTAKCSQWVKNRGF